MYTLYLANIADFVNSSWGLLTTRVACKALLSEREREREWARDARLVAPACMKDEGCSTTGLVIELASFQIKTKAYRRLSQLKTIFQFLANRGRFLSYKFCSLSSWIPSHVAIDDAEEKNLGGFGNLNEPLLPLPIHPPCHDGRCRSFPNGQFRNIFPTFKSAACSSPAYFSWYFPPPAAWTAGKQSIIQPRSRSVIYHPDITWRLGYFKHMRKAQHQTWRYVHPASDLVDLRLHCACDSAVADFRCASSNLGSSPVNMRLPLPCSSNVKFRPPPEEQRWSSVPIPPSCQHYPPIPYVTRQAGGETKEESQGEARNSSQEIVVKSVLDSEGTDCYSIE